MKLVRFMVIFILFTLHSMITVMIICYFTSFLHMITHKLFHWEFYASISLNLRNQTQRDHFLTSWRYWGWSWEMNPCLMLEFITILNNAGKYLLFGSWWKFWVNPIFYNFTPPTLSNMSTWLITSSLKYFL